MRRPAARSNPSPKPKAKPKPKPEPKPKPKPSPNPNPYPNPDPDPNPDLTKAAGGALFAQLVAGLQHAHACGVAHRDLKLENVLLTTG